MKGQQEGTGYGGPPTLTVSTSPTNKEGQWDSCQPSPPKESCVEPEKKRRALEFVPPSPPPPHPSFAGHHHLRSSQHPHHVMGWTWWESQWGEPGSGKAARSLVQLHLKEMFFQLETGRKGMGLWRCQRELPILQGTVLGAGDIEVNKRDRVGPSQSLHSQGTEEADLKQGSSNNPFSSSKC